MWKLLALAILLFCFAGFCAQPGPTQPPKRTGVEPSADEQLFIYLLNKIRSDPAAYGKSIALDLSGVSAQPAVAVNKELIASGRFRADDMLKRNYFEHVDPDGIGPNTHSVESGYVLARQYSRDKNANNIESIAAGHDDPGEILKMLIVDDGVPGLGHRKHLLGMDAFYAKGREIGLGILPHGTYTSKYEAMCAVHIAARDTSGAFVTGVVYEDKNSNGVYDKGEGLGGVSIVAGSAQTVSMAQGGFSLLLPKGGIVVGCHKGGFNGQATASLVINTANTHVEFVSGKKFGIIDFVKGRESK